MARYATTEEEYFCNKCDRYCIEEQMYWPDGMSGGGGYCPGCKETHWIRYLTIGEIKPTDRVVIIQDMRTEAADVQPFMHWRPRRDYDETF